MGKRFTDTQLWEKEWFMKLKPKHKCLWSYLKDRCDQAGVWEPNWALASLYIGEPVSVTDLKEINSHVEILKNGKIFIPDFIDFQYGRLSENSPAHKPVFRAIKKNNLLDRVFSRVSNTLQEKEEEEEKEEDKEKEEEKEKEGAQTSVSKQTKADWFEMIFSDDIFLEQISRAHRGKDVRQAFEECYIHHSNAPNPPTELGEWKQKLNTWLTNTKHGKQIANKSAPHVTSLMDGFQRRHGKNAEGG